MTRWRVEWMKLWDGGWRPTTGLEFTDLPTAQKHLVHTRIRHPDLTYRFARIEVDTQHRIATHTEPVEDDLFA